MHRASLTDPPLEHDAEDPEGFRAGMFRLGRQMPAIDSGASLYELPPGQAICPYHYEYGEEEWVLALSGRPSVRTPEGVEQLEPLDMVFFPKGPEGAHQVRNQTDETVRVLMWSTVVTPSATAYPDSDKVGVWTGIKPENLLVRRASAVDYYEGET